MEDDDQLKIDLIMLKAGIKKINAKAVTGLDAISTRELTALPDESLQELVDILNRINEGVAWPRQVLHHQIVLLGKPKGGERPICLVAMLIKLWEATHADTVLS